MIAASCDSIHYRIRNSVLRTLAVLHTARISYSSATSRFKVRTEFSPTHPIEEITMSILMKRSALAGSLALAIAFGGAAAFISAPGFAYDETSTASINVDQQDVILKGYDAVAYFKEGAPVQGSKEFSASYEGSTYLFASAENRDAFKADPAHYAPQFGGFCAMGAALGKKLDVDPSQFKVVDGKLYLNVNADVFKKWETDIPGHIAQANANWPGIKDKAPNTL